MAPLWVGSTVVMSAALMVDCLAALMAATKVASTAAGSVVGLVPQTAEMSERRWVAHWVGWKAVR